MGRWRGGDGGSAGERSGDGAEGAGRQRQGKVVAEGVSGGGEVAGPMTRGVRGRGRGA